MDLTKRVMEGSMAEEYIYFFEPVDLTAIDFGAKETDIPCTQVAYRNTGSTGRNNHVYEYQGAR